MSKREQIIKITNDYPILPNLAFEWSSYKKIYKLAKKFYLEEWRNNEKPSPAFGGEKVKATRKGFSHIVSKTMTSNYGDAHKRLIHLRNAKQILETTKEVYEKRIIADKDGKKTNQYAILGKIENGLILKVIVHENETNGGKIFLSVFDEMQIKKGNIEHPDCSGNRA